MIEKVTLQNFRCFPWLQVPLKPLTVLIGPNDSGKSAFLAAIRNIGTGHLATGRTDFWRYDESALPAFDLQFSHRGEQIAHCSPIEIFQLPSTGITMESSGRDDSIGPPPLGAIGDGTANVYDYLLRRDRPRFFAALEALKSLIPGFEDLRIGTPSAQTRDVIYSTEHGFEIRAQQASTGVRFLTAFVALAYHPNPPGTILIEEPETGVHPKRLGDIVRLLREVTEGKHGARKAQVIITTHSPYLLDCIDLDLDQILVFRRQSDGSRTAVPADKDRLKAFLDEFMLGEVWYNQGEEGLVAKPS